MHRFSGSFQGKKWEKREAKSAARKWRGEEKGFWGSINSVFWQIMSYSFWWICNLPLPMSCWDHSIYIRTVKPKLYFNFCTFNNQFLPGWSRQKCSVHVAPPKWHINYSLMRKKTELSIYWPFYDLIWSFFYQIS